ncbi:hypothetical protein GQ54DRAFT_127178 [Martensiomyces pterosporus]|nr:hypothetical protein GQ54DRAFT_127178 [Martensiomyces pterosporus]
MLVCASSACVLAARNLNLSSRCLPHSQCPRAHTCAIDTCSPRCRDVDTLVSAHAGALLFGSLLPLHVRLCQSTRTHCAGPSSLTSPLPLPPSFALPWLLSLLFCFFFRWMRSPDRNCRRSRPSSLRTHANALTKENGKRARPLCSCWEWAAGDWQPQRAAVYFCLLLVCAISIPAHCIHALLMLALDLQMSLRAASFWPSRPFAAWLAFWLPPRSPAALRFFSC